MRTLLVILAALFASVGIGLTLREDPGYALLSIGTVTIETSVAVLVIFLVIVFIIFYILASTFIAVLQTPRWAFLAMQRHRLMEAYRLFIKATQEMYEGRWKNAEVTFIKSATHSKTPILSYLGAITAARRLHADSRCENYLHKAESLPEPPRWLGRIASAEIALDHGEAMKAKEILLEVIAARPHLASAYEQLTRCYQTIGDWDALKNLLPTLTKQAVFAPLDLQRLQLQVHREWFIQHAHDGDIQEGRTVWQKLPLELQHEESLVVAYAGYLRDHEAADEAETVLREAIHRQWSPALVVGYGEIGRGNTLGHLATAEGWLAKHGHDAYLLLTCGRLAKRAQQLDKARAYLEQSLRLQATSDAYDELGELCEEMGDVATALHCYRAGLHLLAGRVEEKKTDTAVLAQAQGELAPARAMEGSLPETPALPPEPVSAASATDSLPQNV